MAGSLVEAGTWWTPKQVVEQCDAPTVLGAGMSVWGTRTKHAGYTIRTPAAIKSKSILQLFTKTLHSKIINNWIILPITHKFTYPFYLLMHHSWAKSICCHPHHYFMACFIQKIWVNEWKWLCIYRQRQPWYLPCYCSLLSFCFENKTENILSSTM